MSSKLLDKKKTETNVGMAQLVLVEDGAIAKSVLGSCIGLALYHKELKIGSVCHIVLPQSQKRAGPPGKFADTAIPEMLHLLAKKGANRNGLVAKYAGGANMFKSSGPLQIGQANYTTVKELLEKESISIVNQHIGGEKGRRITFDSQTGKMLVEMMGEESVVL